MAACRRSRVWLGVGFRIAAGRSRNSCHYAAKAQTPGIVHGAGQRHRLCIGRNPTTAHPGLNLHEHIKLDAGLCGCLGQPVDVGWIVDGHDHGSLRRKRAQAPDLRIRYNRSIDENVVETCGGEDLRLAQRRRGDAPGGRSSQLAACHLGTEMTGDHRAYRNRSSGEVSVIGLYIALHQVQVDHQRRSIQLVHRCAGRLKYGAFHGAVISKNSGASRIPQRPGVKQGGAAARAIPT